MQVFDTIPPEPGIYLDGVGEAWVRRDNGTILDPRGEVLATSWTFVLTLFGPWRKAAVQRGER